MSRRLRDTLTFMAAVVVAELVVLAIYHLINWFSP
jgi:hypothetical protein